MGWVGKNSQMHPPTPLQNPLQHTLNIPNPKRRQDRHPRDVRLVNHRRHAALGSHLDEGAVQVTAAAAEHVHRLHAGHVPRQRFVLFIVVVVVVVVIAVRVAAVGRWRRRGGGFPPEDGLVEGLRAAWVLDGDFEPADTSYLLIFVFVPC